MKDPFSTKPVAFSLVIALAACGSVDPEPPEMSVDAGEELEQDAGEAPDAAVACSTLLAMTRFGANQDILTVNPDGSGLTNVTDPGAGNNPSWSPDGARIAFFVIGNPTLVTIMNSDGSGLQPVADGRAPVWSPDGTKLAFTRRQNAQTNIYVINADGTGEVQLTTLGGQRPIFSPDGSRIVFESDRDGDRDIFAMNPDGTAQTNLSANDVTDSRPSVSADSAVVVFASNGELGMVNLDGTGRLTRSLGGVISTPEFSPDGSRIVFSSAQDGIVNVVASALDGSDAIILGEGSSPRWSPNGDAVAYIEQSGVAVADSKIATSGATIVEGAMLDVVWSPCLP